MTNPPNIDAIIAELSEAQRYHVRHGCISGDFTMTTVRALRRKGLFELVVTALDGRHGFMELTPLGLAVRSALIGEVGRDG